MGLNDLTTDDQGSVYTGSLGFDPLSNNKPQPGSLFRVDAPGRATKLWDGIQVTNGLGLSPDRKLLYHSDSPTQAVWVYDVAADRSVKDRRIFAKLPAGMPDGLAVDAEGGVWVAAVRSGEVVHIGADATVKKRIKISGYDGDEPDLRRTRPEGPLCSHGRQHRASRSQGNNIQNARRRRRSTGPAGEVLSISAMCHSRARGCRARGIPDGGSPRVA